MEDWQACSRILSHVLDCTGYSESMINDRRKCYSEISKRATSIEGREVLVSGSKGEGLSNILLSDIDMIFFLDDAPGIFVKDSDVKSYEMYDPTRYIFRVREELSPPGYCMLIFDSRPIRPVCPLGTLSIECSLSVIDKDVSCLPSESFLRLLHEGRQVYDKIRQERDTEAKSLTGPSLPITKRGCMDYDCVRTLSCPCSAELNAWYKRPRHHDWPSLSIQQKVISKPANVVAKEGRFGKMEWRFCFNRAELKLMASLNSTQSKIYVVLKMILKDYLKPENKEITSYVMKNIVLWMCERNPSSSFTPSTLLSWIYVGLQTLKIHIETGNLPYYMILARNLLQGKFSNDTTKRAFLGKLSQLMDSGASLVHVCKSIKLGLELYNDGLLEDYGWKRNFVEIDTFPVDWLPSDVKAKLELLCPKRLAIDRVLLPDFLSLIQGHSPFDIAILYEYRRGLFLNPKKALAFAQAKVYGWLS